MKILSKSFRLSILLALLLSYGSLNAQSEEYDNQCNQFTEAFNDAKQEFQKFIGESSSIGYDGMETVYNYSLWDSKSAEYIEDYMWDDKSVEYNYGIFNELSEAKTLYESLLNNLKGCLPENYALCSEKSGGMALFREYSDDSGGPVIAIMIKEFGQAFQVKISFAI